MNGACAETCTSFTRITEANELALTASLKGGCGVWRKVSPAL